MEAGGAGTPAPGRGGSGTTAGGSNVGGASGSGTSGVGGVSGSGGGVSGTSGLGANAGASGQAAGGEGGAGGAGAMHATGGAAGAGGEGGESPESCLGWNGDCTDAPGCETALDGGEHCGACGVAAPNFEHTLAVCTNEDPSPPRCRQGFADCDLSNYDCETGYDSIVPNCLPVYTGGPAYANASVRFHEAVLAASGELYVAGALSEPLDFDPGPEDDVVTPVGAEEGFVAKFGSDDNYQFTRSFVSASGSSTYVRKLALAPDGSLRAAGYYFDDVDLNPGNGVETRATSAVDGNAFVVALSAEGEFLWGVDLPATERSYIVEASVDAQGNTWLAGEFEGELMAAPGAYGTSDTSGFIAKLDGAGNVSWIRVFTGNEDCYASPLAVVAEQDGKVNALVNVAGRCQLNGAVVPTLQRTRETMVAVLFRFDEQGDFLSAGTLEPADSSSWAHLGLAETRADGTLMAIGYLGGKADFDPTDAVDFRGAQHPTGIIARFDDAELTWMQGVRGHNLNPVVPTASGGALLGGFDGSGNNTSIFGFAPDSRAMFTLGLDPGLELQTIAANADGFVLINSYGDGADLDPSPDSHIVSGSGVAISRFTFANP